MRQVAFLSVAAGVAVAVAVAVAVGVLERQG